MPEHREGRYNPALARLRTAIAGGEGLHLEFKRKVSDPARIVRELIAFANTSGGDLLVGVDDNGTLAGVKHPDEELYAIRQALDAGCRPRLTWQEEVHELPQQRYLIVLHIPPSPRRPHFLLSEEGKRTAFIRLRDMSVVASREMCEIIRRQRQQKNIRFHFGEEEKKLMQYLEQFGSVTPRDFARHVRISRYAAARKLVLLVLANVLTILPSEKGDRYVAKMG